MTKQYCAYNNDTELKNYLIERAIAHRKADQYVTGTYHDENSEQFKGCAVGCSINDLNVKNGTDMSFSDLSGMAEAIDVPVFITRLQDCIFKGLPHSHRFDWPERFFRSINVGADLSQVLPRFLKIILESVLDKVEDPRFIQQKDAVIGSLNVIEDWVKTGDLDRSAAADAANAAYAAADAAYADAADAAAAAAAYAYAAAGNAATAAANAAAGNAARDAYARDAYAAADAATAAYAADAYAAANAAYADAADAAAAANAAANAANARAADKFAYFSNELCRLMEECK